MFDPANSQLRDMQGNPIGMGYRSGAGMYTPETQFNFDPVMLANLGFSPEYINTLQMVVANYGKVTPNVLVQYGLTYEQSRDIKYMYDICTSRTVINSEEDLIKHLKRMFGKDRRIGIQDLLVSQVKEVPRLAVVAGITDEAFRVYNSKNYSRIEDKLYSVVDVTGGRIFVETEKKPKLLWGQSKKLDGVAEIKETKSNGKLIVAFDKKYARLCNRFIIVGSLRRPEFHHGMAEIICIEGTRVYVYAQTLKANDIIKYNFGTQRVYDFGFLKTEIEQKVMKAAASLYPVLCGVQGKVLAANQDFLVMPEEKVVDEEEVLFDEE